MTMMLLLALVLIVVGYLMGSVCSAVIVSKMFELPDPRTEGSKNPGATNVLRLSGKKYAAMVMVADVLKGTIPVLLGHLFGVSVLELGFIAMAAVVGHMYPVFFQFEGGKGVATAIGAFLGLNLIAGVVVAAVWLLVANFSRYSSLASIVSMTLAPIICMTVLRSVDLFFPLFIVTLLIIYKHRANITRLTDGTEPKIGQSK